MIYRKPDYINVGQYDYTGSRPTCTNFVSTNAAVDYKRLTLLRKNVCS